MQNERSMFCVGKPTIFCLHQEWVEPTFFQCSSILLHVLCILHVLTDLDFSQHAVDMDVCTSSDDGLLLNNAVLSVYRDPTL